MHVLFFWLTLFSFFSIAILSVVLVANENYILSIVVANCVVLCLFPYCFYAVKKPKIKNFLVSPAFHSIIPFIIGTLVSHSIFTAKTNNKYDSIVHELMIVLWVAPIVGLLLHLLLFVLTYKKQKYSKACLKQDL